MIKLSKNEIDMLVDSACDFMYYGYSLNSFLNYDSFSHIDKDVLKLVWLEAKKRMF